MSEILTREQQKVEDTWNMQDLYATEEEFAADRELLNGYMKELETLQGTLEQGAAQLLKILELYAKAAQTHEKLYVYANQKYHEDTANGKYQKMSGEMQIVGAAFSQATSWLEPELIAMPKEKLEAYLSENTELKKYSRFMEQITRIRDHVLDAQAEALMARIGELGQAPANIFSMFNNADIIFPDAVDAQGENHPLTVGTFVSLEQSKDRTLRRDAFEKFYGVYKQHINTLGAVYYANLKQEDFFAKEHHYHNAMEMNLDKNAIPVSVYKNLIEAMHKNLPQMYRYVALRKKLLGVDELHMYDVYVPIVERPEKTYSFEEAKEIVKAGLAPLGEDYLALLQEGFDNRWIDVYENKGKRTGAYSWGAYGTHPYVLLNYHGTLKEVFTLAHEMGHALHSYHSDHAQSYLDAGYRIFVAEVASTCNEALLIHYLLEKSTDESERRYLINYFLDQFKGTMYRQTMFAEFEMLTHEIVEKGGMLTAEQINNIYHDLNKKYFGEDMISDSEIAYEWARIPHFYTPFYVYQYSTGFAAAIAISTKILKGEAGIVEKYKKFLSGGCSMDPIDLLRICDVDMESQEPVQAALDVFAEYLKELEQM